MSGYLADDFPPDEDFWAAMHRPKPCPSCNWQSNGSYKIRALLEHPIECECYNCGHEWSIALPLGPSPERDYINSLIEGAKQFKAQQIKLRALIDFLGGLTKTPNL